MLPQSTGLSPSYRCQMGAKLKKVWAESRGRGRKRRQSVPLVQTVRLVGIFFLQQFPTCWLIEKRRKGVGPSRPPASKHTQTRARMHAHAPGIRPLPASVRHGDSAMLREVHATSLGSRYLSIIMINQSSFASDERHLRFRRARDGCGGSHQRQVLTVLSTWASLSVHHDQGKQ